MLRDLLNYFGLGIKTEDIDLFIMEHTKLVNALQNKILNQEVISDYEKEKINKLKELGLVQTQFVVETEKEIKEIDRIKNLKSTIDYFELNYPNKPFVLFGQIENICQKEGFVFCSAKNYTKNIPDANYPSLKNFVLRPEDKTYYGILPEDKNPYHPKCRGFELSNSGIYNSFNGKNPDRVLLFNKKVYFDEFPILICTQPHNLKNEVDKNQKYNVKYGHTTILKPVYKNDIYGFLILTTFKDSEAHESTTNKRNKHHYK